MISFPNCKINLGLRILNKRDDGYHAIESILFPIPFNDILEIVKSDKSNETIFTTSGLKIPGNKDENLCLKAYNLLKTEYELPPVHIHLHKIIPMGGGLGGGSANASFTLILLNDLFKLNLSKDKLSFFASQLGSDCPFFIFETPQYATGRGEILEPVDIDLQGYYLVLLNKGIHVGTQEAYRTVNPKNQYVSLKNIISLPIEKWEKFLINDFEESIFLNYPSLSSIKKYLYEQGAEYAAMTGSGSTMFGIFKKDPSSIPFNINQNGFSKIIKL